MLLETITITFPNPNTELFSINSAYIEDRKKAFMESGKLLRETLTKHPNGLVWVVCRIYRDASARDEWWADPIVIARTVLVDDYNRRNSIKVVSSVAEL